MVPSTNYLRPSVISLHVYIFSVRVRYIQRVLEAGVSQAFPEQTPSFQGRSRRKALRVCRRPADDNDATT
jgi:hypothetical protein